MFYPHLVHSRAANDHSVQLFDTTASRTEAVSTFVRAGLLRGEVVLLVITEEHWDAVVRRLHAAEVPVAATQASGQLVVRDAPGTVRLFRRNGTIDAHLFDRTAGSLVRRLRSAGNRLRIYGEGVDLLAAEGDFKGAVELEELWNALGKRESFSTLCGYASAHFGHPAHADALARICGTHSNVRMHPRDVLGSFLVNMHAGEVSGAMPVRH
jgi:hypothetical protein